MSNTTDKPIKYNREHSKTVVIHVSEGKGFDLPAFQPKIASKQLVINSEYSRNLHKEERKEATHRRNVNNWIVKGQIINISTGQIFAFVIAMFGLYIAWDLGKSGNTVAASVIAAIDLVGLARIFLGKHSFNSEKYQSRKLSKDKL